MSHMDVLVSRGRRVKKCSHPVVAVSVERDVTVITRMRFQFERGGKKQVAGSREKTPRLNDAGKVSIPLSDIYDSLRDAVVNDRAWIQDFQDDEITISQDFHEVLKAYQRYRRAA